MAILVEEAIQRVQSIYSRGVQSRSSRLTSRHIYSTLLSARATLLRQRSNKGQKINIASYSTLMCVGLEKASATECECVPATSCMVLRTEQLLPKFITGIDKDLIKYVTSLDGSERFDLDEFENVKYSVGNKFTGNKPSFYIKNSRGYVTVLKSRRAIDICMLAYDPVEVALFPSVCGECEDCGCLDIMKLEFPIDGDLLKTVAEMANQELVGLFKQNKEDKTNNSSDDTSLGGAMVHQPQDQGDQQ